MAPDSNAVVFALFRAVRQFLLCPRRGGLSGYRRLLEVLFLRPFGPHKGFIRPKSFIRLLEVGP